MKIFFILSRFPYPLEKGDKLRAYQHLINLNASGHEVHLVALSDQKTNDAAFNKIQSICKTVTILPLHVTDILLNVSFAFLRNLPLQTGYFFSKKNQNKIDELLSEISPDLIYCQLIRTAGYVRNHPNYPRIIDYQDAFSKGTLQRKSAAAWWIKPLFSRELNLVKILELQSYDWFDAHLIISKQDKLALNVLHDAEIAIVPNGVDTTHFFPVAAEKKADVTFVGNMNYPPNVDSVCFLVNEIMPIVWKYFPGATVQIAGANPHKKVRALATELVSVTGWVEDIRHCYALSKIIVAPMRMGTGLQNKLLEAMAMGIPCVTTPLSVNPLGATHEVDILVGRDAKEISEQILRLLNSDSLREQIGNNGWKFVLINYSMEHSRLLLEKVIKEAIVNFKKKRVV